MLAIGMVTFASAQQHKQNNKNIKHQTQVVKTKAPERDYGRNDQADFNSYSFNSKQKQENINHIHREYEQKIQAMQRSKFRTADMRLKVRQLEQQRDAEIRRVEEKYNNSVHNNRSHFIAKTNHARR